MKYKNLTVSGVLICIRFVFAMRFERTQNRANRSRTELSRADFPFCHNQVTNPSTRDWGTGLAGVRHAVPVPVPQQNPGPYPGGLPYPCRSLSATHSSKLEDVTVADVPLLLRVG